MRRTIRFAVAVLLLASTTMMSSHAATITVTNTNDSGPGSLRQALANAANGDTINFAVTGDIVLTGDALQVAKNITIAGPGADQLSISSQPFGQAVFHIVSGKTVTISGLTISVGGILNDEAILTVSNCVLSFNTIGLYNNAAFNFDAIASVTIINSLFVDNTEGIFNESGPSLGSTRTLVRGSSLVRKPADGRSRTGNCTACVTIANSVVTRNNFGYRNATNLAATVTVLNSTFTGHNLEAILSYGNAGITVTNSTISGNLVGIETNFANVSIANSTISDNSGWRGGVFAASGDLSIVNSTISGNSATTGTGGGIYGNGLDDLSIVNSTISGNSAKTGTGGGIYNFNSPLRVTNSTITGNSAASGGGIYNDGSGGASVVEISNTILNAGASGENIFNNGGTVTSLGYNLSSDDGGGYLTGPGDQINTDPLLGLLQNNGGPTFTHALLPGSPAIDAGDPNFTPPPLYDQRGCPFDRVFNGRIDIGSFEVQPPRRPCPTPRPRPTPAPRS
jgi:Right handed beta helix region